MGAHETADAVLTRLEADRLRARIDRRLISHLTPGCTCDHRPGDSCNASCPVHLGAGLTRR